MNAKISIEAFDWDALEFGGLRIERVRGNEPLFRAKLNDLVGEGEHIKDAVWDLENKCEDKKYYYQRMIDLVLSTLQKYEN